MEIAVTLSEDTEFTRDQNWHEPTDIAEALEQSLARLQLDYGRNMPEL